jgi:hypothetical protein
MPPRLVIPLERPVAVVNSFKPEINFKRVSGGWVFRGPNPWLVGKAPHYLVSDDQRFRVIALIRSAMVTVPLMVIIAVIVVVSVAVYWNLGDIGLAFLSVAAMLIGIFGAALLQQQRLKPILADASRTNERVTYAEMRKAEEDSTPPEQVRLRWMLPALCSVLFGLQVILNLDRPGRAIVYTLLLFGFAWRAVRWYRVSKRSRSSAT